VARVYLGPGLRGLKDEVVGLADSAGWVGFEDGPVAQDGCWGLVGCLVGSGWDDFLLVVEFRVDHCLAAAFRVGRCPVVWFRVAHCPVVACLVGLDGLAALLAGGRREDDWRVVDSLGCRGNTRVGGRPAVATGREDGSLVGDSASCRRIRDSRRSRVGVGDTRRREDDSPRPRLLPMGRDCSRRRDPIPIPTRPIPRAGCWR
jgi:hypothetical protein